MKKRLLLLILILIAPSAFGMIYIDSVNCTEGNNIIAYFTYTCPGHCLKTNSIRTTGIKAFIDRAVNVSEQIEGKFYFKGDEVDLINDVKGLYTFVSGNVTSQQQSILRIEDSDSNASMKFSCPAFKYNCDRLNVDIKRCYTHNKRFYAQISGLDEEASFYMNAEYSRGNLRHDPFPSNYSLIKEPEGDYYFIVPTRNLAAKKTKSFMVSYPACSSLIFNSSKIKNCFELDKCYDDLDCAFDEICNDETKICEKISCYPCEIAAKHSCRDACVSSEVCVKAACQEGVCSYTKVKNCCVNDNDCDDGLECTNDTCKDGRCGYEEIICEDMDYNPCSTGKCIEGEGCRYVKQAGCSVSKAGVPKSVVFIFIALLAVIIIMLYLNLRKR